MTPERERQKALIKKLETRYSWVEFRRHLDLPEDALINDVALAIQSLHESEDRLRAENAALLLRLEHCLIALRCIANTPPDMPKIKGRTEGWWYQLVSEMRQQALDASVVEERVPTLMDQVRSAQRSMAEWPQWMKDAVTEARAADAEQHGTVWKQRAKSDPYCANCGLTWDMHLCDGRTSCPDRKRAPAVQGREPQCDHPVHSNPGLIVPCPSCGADTLDGVSNAQDVETHGPCGWDETDRGP